MAVGAKGSREKMDELEGGQSGLADWLKSVLLAKEHASWRGAVQ